MNPWRAGLELAFDRQHYEIVVPTLNEHDPYAYLKDVTHAPARPRHKHQSEISRLHFKSSLHKYDFQQHEIQRRQLPAHRTRFPPTTTHGAAVLFL